MSHVVSLEWLKEHLSDPDLIIVDCRFTLGSPDVGQAQYAEGHIPGAAYFDLEKDLSGAKGEHGGRHPFPVIEEVIQKLGDLGIDEHKKVVAYDDQGGAMASRFWWLLQYLDHPQASVLDQGFSAWKTKGFPVNAVVPEPKPVHFTPRIQEHLLVEMEYVRSKMEDPGVVLIDSRDEKRYKGLEEPVDRVAGHIPHAKNYFWKGVLAEEGRWKSEEQLKDWFQQVDPEKEVIVYCGSGVTACPNILALKSAGYANVKLYLGSWSDWISYSENPIATEK